MDFADVRVRLLVILGVVGLCLFLIYPVHDTINLGLDLRGGIHMVMRVKTADAVKNEVELARDRMRTATDCACP